MAEGAGGVAGGSAVAPNVGKDARSPDSLVLRGLYGREANNAPWGGRVAVLLEDTFGGAVRTALGLVVDNTREHASYQDNRAT